MIQFTPKMGDPETCLEIYLGKVLNYYKKIQVAEILLETSSLSLGDDIMLQGNKTGVAEEKVTSIEIKNKKVKLAKKGQRVGLKIRAIVRENDKIYLWR